MKDKLLIATKTKKTIEYIFTICDNYPHKYIELRKRIINNCNYKVSKYNIFLIREPKLRIIMSQNITDKVINHLVAKYFLVNVFDKSFIDTNVATRIGKGTHYGLIKVKKYLNELDHYIKEILGIKYYVRYMDDGILIHEDKNYLKYCLSKILLY